MTSTSEPTRPADAAAAADGVDLDELVARLSLEEKVRLLTGADAWATAALPSIGLRSMVLSDGPSGVRGDTWDERDPSLCLPSATALSSSWDVDLSRRYGAVAAAEARRKGVEVILGPTVNLHRSPLGGRHFEAFSEDPVLTADLAAAYVSGVQDGGVAATPKHYVANDFETDRYHVDVRVADRTLRELYLLAFERGVREAHAWCVMSAYNAVNGVTSTENPLLSEPLNGSWGFDGVVVSDWTAVRSLESARQPQDLAMPGPEGPWGAALVRAVQDGDVAEAVVDRKVRRLLRLAARVGALDGSPSRPAGVAEDGVAFARHAAAEGMVLVQNDGILPLRAEPGPDAGLTRVAVIGDHAKRPRIQGGGSATVLPARTVSPLAGLRAALPGSVDVTWELGTPVDRGFSPLDPERMSNPVTGGAGAQVVYHDAAGAVLSTEARFASLIMELGTGQEAQQRASLSFETRYHPTATGELRLGFASPGHGLLWVDGRLVLDDVVPDDSDQVQAFFLPASVATAVEVVADRPIDLRWHFTPGAIVDGVPGSIAVTFGTQPTPRSPAEDEESLARAVEAARQADVAVVVVGTTEEVESEGYDRTDLRLPGRQDDLVSAVAAANPRTIVVVNAGAPVEMPWRHDVAAVVLSWFGGQEFGDALADVLLGRVEPGGRLPTTWPDRLSDVPVAAAVPVDGQVHYTEGIHIGYRAWLRSGAVPAYPFGHGLGYSAWRLGPTVVAPSTDGSVRVEVPAANVGGRTSKQVVQVYARRPRSEVERPVRWLVGFAVVRAAPGEQQTVVVDVPRRALAYWGGEGWVIEPGPYELLVGTSVTELGAPVPILVEA